MTYPLAVGHTGAVEKTEVVRPLADDTRLWPAGYLYSTAADLARFAIAFLNGGRLDGSPVWPEGVSRRMSAPHAVLPNVFHERNGRYGYGLMMFDHRGARVVEHGGDMPGYSALLRMVPERRFAVVVLANRGGVPFQRTADRAMELLLPLATTLPPAPPAPHPVDPSEVDRWVGRYENRWPMELVRHDGVLALRMAGGDPMPVKALGGGRYVATRPGTPQRFEFVLAPATATAPAYLHFALRSAFRLFLNPVASICVWPDGTASAGADRIAARLPRARPPLRASRPQPDRPHRPGPGPGRGARARGARRGDRGRPGGPAARVSRGDRAPLSRGPVVRGGWRRDGRARRNGEDVRASRPPRAGRCAGRGRLAART